MGFPKIRGTLFLGVPIIRIVVFWGLELPNSPLAIDCTEVANSQDLSSP